MGAIKQSTGALFDRVYYSWQIIIKHFGRLESKVMSRQSGLIRWLRNFLAGRDLDMHTHQREIKSQSSRSVPAPHLPSGPAHKLADNYYYSRDARRAVGPPTVISTSASLELLSAGSEVQKTMDTDTSLDSRLPPVPGTGHTWEEIEPTSFTY